MLLVDSSVWIDLMRNTDTAATKHLAKAISHRPIAIGDLVLAEVLQGYASDRAFREGTRLLTKFTPITICDQDIAVQAARNYRTLRARGITIRKTIDCLIATRCIIEGWPLLYSDRDFDPFVAHLGLRSALAEAT